MRKLGKNWQGSSGVDGWVTSAARVVSTFSLPLLQRVVLEAIYYLATLHPWPKTSLLNARHSHVCSLQWSSKCVNLSYMYFGVLTTLIVYATRGLCRVQQTLPDPRKLNLLACTQNCDHQVTTLSTSARISPRLCLEPGQGCHPWAKTDHGQPQNLGRDV